MPVTQEEGLAARAVLRREEKEEWLSARLGGWMRGRRNAKKGTDDGETKVCRARNTAKFVGSRRTFRYTSRVTLCWSTHSTFRMWTDWLRVSRKEGNERERSVISDGMSRQSRRKKENERARSFEATSTGNESKSTMSIHFYWTRIA